MSAAAWLIGNGLGGSASGPIAGSPAHPRQALLIAGAGAHPRVVLLALEERIAGTGAPRWLAEADAPEADEGRARLEAFGGDPWPTWRWRAGDTLLERVVFVPTGHDAVVVAWRHLAGPPVHVAASPLCATRRLDEPPALAAPALAELRGIPGRVRIGMAGDGPPLVLWHDGTFLPARAWRTLVYRDRATREGALVPGHAEGLVAPGRGFHLVFATEERLFPALADEQRLGEPVARTLAGCVAALEHGERERRGRWHVAAARGADFTARQAATAHHAADDAAVPGGEPRLDEDDPVLRDLALAVRAGLVRRGPRRTLLGTPAGGVERGEEALRAVTALVSLRAFGLAREVLGGYVEYLDEGLAPEAFDAADGGPRYGDPAPSLWLVAAADLYARRSADGEFLAATLYPALDGVMQALRQGTRHGVGVDRDGLLAVAGVKRADLNALWYHALVAMAQMARVLSHRETAAFYLAWAHEHQQRFEAFWNEADGCLFEALGADGPRRGTSPAQALAASLPPSLLEPDRAARLVATLERELATRHGLREAAGSDVVSIAALGVFASAYLRVHGRDAAAQARVRGWVEGALEIAPVSQQVPDRLHLRADGAVAVPLDGGASTLAAAELLRLWVEELEHAPLPLSATSASSSPRA